MKKTYTKPMLEIEQYRLTQQISSCTYLKIGSGDSNCVLKDPDAPDEMKVLAWNKVFLDYAGCVRSASMAKDYERICWNTSINMAFTS